LTEEHASSVHQSDEDTSTEMATVDIDLSSFNEYFGLLSYPLISICCHSSSRKEVLLEELNPTHIILYEAEPRFIRQLEVRVCHCTVPKDVRSAAHRFHSFKIYKAMRPNQDMKVYFMMYENSVEEQRYLTAVRKEKDAFERLIREKSVRYVSI
jgi:DNA excision repair protein ERCC-4